MPLLDFSLSYPLPAGCAPERVLACLHRYEPLITQNPNMVSFCRRPVDLAEIIDDPFFREDGHALVAYEVVDRIVIVPGVAKKQVVIPCVMQRFDGGVRCRSLAVGGIRVWSTWRVLPAAEAAQRDPAAARFSSDEPRRLSFSSIRRQRHDAPRAEAVSVISAASAATTSSTAPPAAAFASPTPPATPPAAANNRDGQYVLVEEARVECGSLVKPFVSRNFQEAHLEILRLVVRDVMAEPQKRYMTYTYA